MSGWNWNAHPPSPAVAATAADADSVRAVSWPACLAWLGYPIFLGETFVFCAGTLTRNNRSVVLFYTVGLSFFVCVCPEEKGSRYITLYRTRRQHGISIHVNQGSAKSVLFFLIWFFCCFFRACVRRTAFATLPRSLLHEHAARGARSRVYLHAWDQTQTGTLSWVPGA